MDVWVMLCMMVITKEGTVDYYKGEEDTILQLVTVQRLERKEGV